MAVMCDLLATTVAIQRVFKPGMPSPVYRLSAYQQDCMFTPVDFPSKDVLLQRLTAIVPGFNQEQFPSEDKEITFFRSRLALSAEQMEYLGLQRSHVIATDERQWREL